ncbi:Threonine synthase-like 1 [Mytilus edulis]|uniref:Threonine synthase-like 1 n=1 Tax=Mytilus edulis TaxID=6550 RepID=A0A8S3QFT9_MYTED|nr:Threonine synthase-like 1 [Mytilus edulis]
MIQRFFTHIASVLDTTISDTLLSYSNLVIGSDEEKALVKAIKDSFPTSELTLCTRHLSENVTRHLRTKVGVNDKNAKQILSDLFGDNGLIEADTTVDFSTKVTDIERKYEDLVGPYLTQKVIPTIRDYVYNARKTESRIPLQWKNNNCESINHILKLNQDWKPEKLPELINKIHKEIKLQESLVNGALYGHGDFELSSSAYDIRVICEENETQDSIAGKIVAELKRYQNSSGYVSTRDLSKQPHEVKFSEAILQGLAPDGGLFVPNNIIAKFSEKQLDRLVDLTYQDRALRILEKWIHPDDLHPTLLKQFINTAYSEGSFDSKEIFPIRHLEKNQYLLELFHGPTSSFKDAALQLLPQFFVHALQVLGRTSTR